MAEAWANSALKSAQETVASTTETARTTLVDAQKTAEASAETVKTEAAAAPDKLSEAKAAVDGAVSRGIEGAKSLFQSADDKRSEVSSQIFGAVTNLVGGGSGGAGSTTVASRDLPVSVDNQPLLAGERGIEKTPWWKNCCGVLDLCKPSSTR